MIWKEKGINIEAGGGIFRLTCYGGKYLAFHDDTFIGEGTLLEAINLCEASPYAQSVHTDKLLVAGWKPVKTGYWEKDGLWMVRVGPNLWSVWSSDGSTVIKAVDFESALDEATRYCAQQDIQAKSPYVIDVRA